MHDPTLKAPGTAPAAHPPCPAWCTSKHIIDADREYRIHSATLGETIRGMDMVAVRVVRVDSVDPAYPSQPAVVSVVCDHYGADDVSHTLLPDLTGDQTRTLALVTEATGGNAEFVAALRRAADFLEMAGHAEQVADADRADAGVVDDDQDDTGREAGESR